LKNCTKAGKARKQRIVEKLIFRERKTRLQMSLYSSVLPILKAYVCLFQTRDPLAHKLHQKQEQVFRQLLACFVKPQNLMKLVGPDGDKTQVPLSVKALQTLVLDKDQGQILKENEMFCGSVATDIIKECRKDDPLLVVFFDQMKSAYMVCAEYLQKKLPLNNPFLKAISTLDPTLPKDSLVTRELKKLRDLVPANLTTEEMQAYETEVVQYIADSNPPFTGKIDEYWVKQRAQYPVLCKIALTVCSLFHGPQVESSFSIMGNVLTSKRSNTGVDTCSAFLCVKHHLIASKKTSIQYFAREVHGPVDRGLCKNMRNAYRAYSTALKEKKDTEVHVDLSGMETKKAAKESMQKQACQEMIDFQNKSVKGSMQKPACQEMLAFQNKSEMQARTKALKELAKKRQGKAVQGKAVEKKTQSSRVSGVQSTHKFKRIKYHPMM
jgi:hypothetical protein